MARGFIPGNWRRRHAQTVAFVLCLLVLALPAAAQDCAGLLQDADADYHLGAFESALASVAACLEGRSTRAEKARAYELRAKIHLALDDVEAARRAVARLLDKQPDFSPRPAVDPAPFVDLVEAERQERAATLIGSVSKTPEELRLAPATVVVVTAEEIERRGYLDLEQVIHDLPGFDVTRGNGEVYSSLYQRGYRSARNDRLLLLVDGVEQNDVHSNTAYLSRQFPLSNVERIEVVYGPASTLYGANAYTGVISIVTKDSAAEGRKLGGDVRLAAGSFDTRSLDVSLWGSSPARGLSWSLTGRLHRSDEPDLSGFADWDYDSPQALDAVNYRRIMRVEGAPARTLLDEPALGLSDACAETALCVVRDDGQVTTIELTDLGAEVARQRDEELFATLRELGEPIAFSDATDDGYIYGKLRIENFKLGLQIWRLDEGTTPWYTELLRTGRDAGSVWIPRQTSFYLSYARPIGSDLSLSFFSRYKEHELDDGSAVSRFGTYANGFLNVVELAAFDTQSFLQRISLGQASNQLRNELSVLYEPSERFNLVAGIEARNSSVQADFVSEVVAQEPATGFVFFRTQEDRETIESRDLGVFAQVSFRPRADFKIVAGGRLDDNEVRESQRVTNAATGDRLETSGFGSVFTPRLALVYSPGDLVFKAIYAEAFKEPSNFQKYTREPGVREFANETLDEERVRNAEVAVGWAPRDEVSVEVAAYESVYSSTVGLRESFDAGFFPNFNGQFANLGSLRIRGLQAMASLRLGRYAVFGNYTFTDPVNTDPRDDFGEPLSGVSELRVGDIARHRLNLGVNVRWSEELDFDVRTNYVGPRRTGEGTTVANNPFTQVDAYFVVHATVSYRDLFRGASLQLIVNNLFDSDYEHPGVERAGRGFAARIPQTGRAVFLRAIYRF